MKNFLVYLLFAVFCFAACSGDDVIPDVPDTPMPEPVVPLTIPTSENLAPSFSSDGGTATVAFTANVSWTAKVTDATATWCTVSPASGGNGNHTLTISTSANDTPDSRTASVQLTAGTVTKTINVTQKQKDALTITSNKFEVPKEGGLIEIEAKANIELSHTISEEGKAWISFVGTRAMKTSYLTFKVEANDSIAKREAKITLKGGDLTEEITVTQEAGEAAQFSISSTNVEVGAEQGTFELTITSSIGYEVKSEASWIKEVTTKASNEHIHKFEVSANTSAQERQGIIVVCNDEQVCIPVTVKQKGAQGISISQTEFNVGPEGETIEITVTGDVEEVAIPVDWIKQEGTASGVYKFSISKNEGADARTSEITFRNTIQNSEAKVKVNQLGSAGFSLSASSVEVGYGKSTFELTVTSSIGYEIKPQVDWIKEITTRAVGVQVHKFEVSANPSNDARQGVIVVCNDNQVCIPVTVSQQGAPAEGEEWKTKDFYHKSLAMRFTADWCGACPKMTVAMAEIQKQFPDKLEVLSIHGPRSKLESDASLNLVSQYSINSYPRGIVNGTYIIMNSNNVIKDVISVIEESEAKYSTVAGASWNSSVAGNKVSLDLKVYLKKSGTYKVTALLVEDNIVGYQADYINGSSDNYVHKDVIRGAFSDALGDAVSISVDGEIKTFNYSLDVPAGCNKDNLRVVVYVQAQDNNGAYYVNNATSAAVGNQQPLMVKSSNSGGVEGIVPGDDIIFNN